MVLASTHVPRGLLEEENARVWVPLKHSEFVRETLHSRYVPDASVTL